MNSLNKTFLPVQNYKNRQWFVIDCKGESLGRLATLVSKILKGKMKPNYHPAVDIGDHVILINADLVSLNTTSQHYFVFKPGRPGHSLKIRKVSECLPSLTIKKSIKGMLPKVQTKRLMKRVHVYNGQNHPHQAQSPIHINRTNFYSNFRVDESN